MAQKDFENIYGYVDKILQADKSAENLVIKIKRKILKLEKNPYMYPKVCTKPKHELYHKLTVKKYVVLYQIDEKRKNVVIHKIEYAMKDYLYFE